jgi:hypothetical protein
VESAIWVGKHSFSCPDVSLTGNCQLEAGRTDEDTLGSVIGRCAANNSTSKTGGDAAATRLGILVPANLAGAVSLIQHANEFS